MKKSSRKKKRRKRIPRICFICWIILPFAIVALLILEAIGLYQFNTARLIVIGVCVLVILIPFFGEITVNNISIKKDEDTK